MPRPDPNIQPLAVGQRSHHVRCGLNRQVGLKEWKESEMSEYGVIAKGLKNDLAQALAKFGDANRSESVQTVMAQAMTIRNTLAKDPEYKASKAIADAQKKDIDAFQAIIKC